MSGFTKLVPEIIQSSIWNEPSDVRIVWITLLAVKDENGYVRGDVRTIARLANVPMAAAETAIASFLAPDPASHTPTNEGRRIAPAAGGYMVLNHELYRGRDQRADHAEYVRQWRKNRESKHDVINCESQVNHPSVSASVSGVINTADFDAFWKAYPRKIGKGAALASWKKHKPPLEKSLQTIAAFLKCDQWKKDGGKFIPHPATWINQGRWDDVVTTPITAPRNYI